jgi:glycosyltransferase involved in cell wall biosynthesis
MISVIIPVYNAQNYLNRCINTVLHQTYRQLEILLIDDGSTDKSGDMCDTFALLDSRIKVIHTQNGGTSAARNIGIEHSTGEFITFLDADDSLEKDALELLLDSYMWLASDLVIGDFKLNGNRFMFSTNRTFGKEDIHSYLFGYLNKPTGHSMFVYVWGKLFKSSIIRAHNIRFNEGMKIFEDSLFNMHYLRCVKSASYVRNHLYRYNTGDHPSAEYGIYKDPLRFITAIESIVQYLGDDILTKQAGRQACVSFAIRQMIRYFSLNAKVDRKQISNLMTRIVNNHDVRRGLLFYEPCKGDSRIIPLLMKWKWITPLMWACEWRARCRE